MKASAENCDTRLTMVLGGGVPLAVATTSISFVEESHATLQRPSLQRFPGRSRTVGDGDIKSEAPGGGQGRPWSAVLSSKPLWGASAKERPVVLGAFPAAYRNMQPEVRQIATGWQGAEDRLLLRQKDKAQHALAGGLQALLAESTERQGQVKNAVIGTGKGSRLDRANEEMERNIQERMERLKAKEKEKAGKGSGNAAPLPQPGVLTGWLDLAPSDPDVPNLEGDVVNLSSSSVGSVDKEGKQRRERREPLREDSLASPSIAERSGMRSPPKASQQDLAQGLQNILSDSTKREEAYGSARGVGTGKGSRIAKAQLEREKRIQDRLKRLEAQDAASCDRDPDATHAKDRELLHDQMSAEESGNAGYQDASAARALSGARLDAGGCSGQVDDLAAEVSKISREAGPSNTWSDDKGLTVKRTSRKADAARLNDSQAKPRLSEMSYDSSDSQKRQQLGLRAPSASSKYAIAASDFGGILRVRSGDSDIDHKFGFTKVPSDRENSRDSGCFQRDMHVDGNSSVAQELQAQSPADMLKSGGMRWAKRLELGALVLQRSLRCHIARVQHREMVLLMESDDQVHKRDNQSATLMATIGLAGKLKRRVGKFRSFKDHAAEDDLLLLACTNAAPRLRACYLRGHMQDFLNVLDLHSDNFCRLRHQLPSIIQFHFDEAISRANQHARCVSFANDAAAEWETVGAAAQCLHLAGERYVKVGGEDMVLRAQDGEDAPRLARALQMFLMKLKKSTKMSTDMGKMPNMEMAAKWLRMNQYNAARALAYYEKLLEISDAWPTEIGKVVSVWKPRAQDFVEMEDRGLRLLRSADGGVLHDRYGGAVAVIDAHKVYVKGKHSLQDMQAILLLFFHSLSTDCPSAVRSGISVVMNMTKIHHGGFYYTMARDVHDYCRQVLPAGLVTHVWYYGARGLFGAGFLTATKLVFNMVYKNISYIDCASGDEFDLSQVKKALQIVDQSETPDAATNLHPSPALKAFAPAQPVIQRTVSAFSRLLSQRSQAIELERNNVEQQALLYRDGWYGHFDTSSSDKDLKPYFEGGCERLKLMRKKRPPATHSTESVQVDEVQGLVCGIKVGIPRTRVVHAESLARACTGALARLCRPALFLSGGIEPLVDMLQGGDTEEKRAAALAIAKACIGNTQNARRAEECGGLVPLINIAACGPEQTRANVCEALAEICKAYQPACQLAFESHAIQTMVKCIENGVGVTQQQALRAIAAICSHSEGARRECAVSHGWFVIFTGLQSLDILVQSAAAASMRALFSDAGDPYKVVKGVRELDGLALLAKMLNSSDMEAVANASAALAESMESDMASVDFFLRCGAVHAMLAVCQRYQGLNTLMASVTSDDDGMCAIEDLQEMWAQQHSETIDLHHLQDCLHMLSPEREDRVAISKWFECQRYITLALKLAFLSEICYAGRNLAEEAGSEILRFPSGIKLLCQLGTLTRNYPIDEARCFGGHLTMQEEALEALAGILRLDSLAHQAIEQLLHLRIIPALLAVFQQGCRQLQAFSSALLHFHRLFCRYLSSDICFAPGSMLSCGFYGTHHLGATVSVRAAN